MQYRVQPLTTSTPADNQQLSLGGLSGIIPGSVTNIIITPQGLQLSYRNKPSVSISWAQMASSPKLQRGVLFSRLELNNGEQPVTLRWLGKGSSRKLYSLSSEHFYRQKHADVAVALEKIHGFVFAAANRPKRYLRSSHCQRISEYAAGLLRNLRIPATGLQLPQQLRDDFHQLHQWARCTPEFTCSLRQAYVDSQLQQYQNLFDSIETNPLTPAQRLACITDEDHNLILAGAGTGKTSTMIGRTGYLLHSGQAKGHEILMLAYGSQAAAEMRQRMQEKLSGPQIKEGVQARTFHSLGQQIIIQVEQYKPSITPLASDPKLLAQHVDRWFEELLQLPDYQSLALQYFRHYLYPAANPFAFKTASEYAEYLRINEIRTLKGEAVKSYGECLIANWLFTMGVEYQYELSYQESVTATAEHRAYRPDFYLTESGIYLEHFGIDRQFNTAPYVDRGAYVAAIDWKRQLHADNNTTMIETYHYEQQENSLLRNLQQKLSETGVEFRPLPAASVLQTLRNFGAISRFSQLLSQLLQAYKAGCYNQQRLAAKVQQADNPGQLQAAIGLLLPVVERYEDLLRMNQQIDFDDMIGKAIEYVEQGRFKSPWKHILVDEFQDISEPRARLVRALQNSRKDTSVFCVGDDWQAIYRFSGSDVSLTSGFASYFGATQTTTLDKTFRFNNSISDVASRFVMQNPAQIAKQMTTHNRVSQPAVTVLSHSSAGSQPNGFNLAALTAALDSIAAQAKPGSSVYLLARYWHKMPASGTWQQLQQRYSQLQLNQQSLHASKGREADYVILLGLDNSKTGFPARRISHPLLEALLPAAEAYPLAEERRLFYVALTRARHQVYLLSPAGAESVFIKELQQQDYPLQTVKLTDPAANPVTQAQPGVVCTACQNGFMHTDNRKAGRLSCSNFPLCKHSVSRCPECQQILQQQGRYQLCSSPGCNFWQPQCPQCDNTLSLRHGQYGEFWGCNSFNSETNSCNHTETQITPPVFAEPS